MIVKFVDVDSFLEEYFIYFKSDVVMVGGEVRDFFKVKVKFFK